MVDGVALWARDDGEELTASACAKVLEALRLWKNEWVPFDVVGLSGGFPAWRRIMPHEAGAVQAAIERPPEGLALVEVPVASEGLDLLLDATFRCSKEP
ncbi:MAG: hypothetical protein IPG81_19050 [Sandaracinaceae bacterium]|nr:hypothetical protein [Sandaracinaceae bacterium]